MGRWGRTGRVSVVAIGSALALTACTPPDSTDDPTATASTSKAEHPTSVASSADGLAREDLDAALQAAANALLATPAFEGGLVTRVEGEVVTRAWGRQMAGFRRVEFVQFDLVGAAGGTPGTDPRVRTTATVFVDDVRYEASRGPDGDRPWATSDAFGTATELNSARTAVTWGLTLEGMAEGHYTSGLDVESIAVDEAPDGTTTWRMTDEEGGRKEWDVAADGHLQAYRMQTDEDAEPFARSWDLRFRVADTDPPVVAPEEGTPLDLDRFDVWDDLAVDG